MAVKKMQDQKCKFRVLGLSATPGSSNEAIQVLPTTAVTAACQRMQHFLHCGPCHGSFLHNLQITDLTVQSSLRAAALSSLSRSVIPHNVMQEVIDNLTISAIQHRSESDPDIQPHVHQRCVEEIVVKPTREVDYCKQTLLKVLAGIMQSLARMQVGQHSIVTMSFRFALKQASGCMHVIMACALTSAECLTSCASVRLEPAHVCRPSLAR